MHKLRSLFLGIYNESVRYLDWVVCFLPGWTGAMLRRQRMRFKLAQCGHDASFGAGVLVTGSRGIAVGLNFASGDGCSLLAHGGGTIVIGDSVSLNSEVVLNASGGGGIVIGDNVLIGPRCYFRTSNHRADRTDIPIRCQGHVSGRIEIQDDVWIGACAVILPHVKIGRGAVVGAGAVVTRDVPEFAVVGGVPARVLRSRT